MSTEGERPGGRRPGIPAGEASPTMGQRHPGDVIRVVLGAVVLALAALSVRDARVGLTEANLFQAINRLPGFLEDPFVIVQIAALVAGIAAPLLALVLRRWRLARDLALSALLSFLAAEGIERLVERGRPSGLLGGVELRGIDATGLGFPSTHVAVTAGLAAAASPFLTRRSRRVAWTLVVLVGVARIYVGAHLPVDSVGGFAVGWIAGALVHLALGSPAQLPSAGAVRDALARIGVRTEDRSLRVRTVGRDRRDADLLDQAWRAVAYRGDNAQQFLTAVQAVEHEAYLTLLAARAGAQTPDVVGTASLPGGAVIAEKRIEARSLSELAEDAMDDALLARVWEQLAVLRRARLAHGSLCAEHVLVDADGSVWLVDWSGGHAAASERKMTTDLVELLASLAVEVGADRAVASAVRALGPDALVPALPLVQPAVLSRTTRRAVHRHKGVLDELRERAAGAAGAEAPTLQPLTRIRPETIVAVVVLAFGVHLLAPQVGELGTAFEAIANSNPAWLLVALVASLATYVAGALSQTGAVRQQLALTRTTAMQMGAAFTGRLTPASVGTVAVRIRFLQRSGLDREDAVTATALNSVAGGVARIVALVAAIPLLGASGFGSEVPRPDDWEVLVAVVVVGAIASIVFFTAVGRRLLQPVRSALRELGVVVRDPSKATALLGGALGVIALNTVCFAASLAAVGAHVGPSTAIVVYLGGSTVGGAAPTPGGLGTVEAALVAGLTAAGTDASLAVAGVVTFRLLTYWLPIPLGYLTLRRLRHEDLL